jgi:uncharacterized protein YbjT (DUF2867 family)
MSKTSTASANNRVLVMGALGYIGTNLVSRLMREGMTVRAVADTIGPLMARDWTGVDVLEADVLVPGTLPAALEGIDTAYYLVRSIGAGKDFGKLNQHAAENFAKAAAAAGVKRIVYLGGLAEDTEDEHLLSRRETGIALRAGTVPVIELRAGIVVGPGSAAFEIMRHLALNLPVLFTPRWLHRKSPPIALENLLEYLVRLPQIPEALGGVFEAGGPEVLTYADMIRTLARAVGKRPPLIIPLPVSSPRLSARWLWLPQFGFPSYR